MVQWAVIVVIIISLVAGMYAIILLGAMRKRYQLDYLNSYFYYQILHFLFGLYGILGNLAVRQILLKFDIKESNIGAIALFFPFLGVPFILAAWYLFIKFSSELINKKVSQYIAIGYFTMATCVFFVFGWFVQKMPEMSYQTLNQKAITIFYAIDLIVAFYASIILFIHCFNKQMLSMKVYLVRFGIITIGLATLRAISLYFTDSHWIIGLYFLVLFFSGNLSGILLTKVNLARNNHSDQSIFVDNSDIYTKFGISKREKEIITEICKGKTNQQIADEMFISLQTVKDHTHNIFKKVNVKNRVQLAKIFIQ